MTARRAEAVVVGASAGAFEALSTLLSKLPRNYPLPILVVVHLRSGHESLIARLLQDCCLLTIREAEDKETIIGGTVYIGPPDYHLMIEPDHRLSLSADEPVQYSRPSIDVLFETAVEAYGPDLVGVVLTGANSDGARGLRAICDAGGVGLVQRPDTASAPTMPRTALEACPNASALSLEEIAERLLSMVEI